MKEKLSGPNMGRRVAMTVCGVLLTGVVVGLFKASRMGVDPFQVLCAGLDHVIPVPFGTLYVIVNLVLLVGMFFADRHYIGLGTVINMLFLGYVAQYAQNFFQFLLPNPSLAARVAMLLVAIPFLCLAGSLYITADLGVSTYDVWALTLERRTRYPFRVLRVGTDLLCVGLGFALLGFAPAGMIGPGTIVTAFFTGPLIDFFNRKVSRPLLER
ncbi:MAG: hypothetical protein IKR84_05605 [Oscillibacter sp.]|nr:hypothetical protein [Oscillibacter sp.]